MFSKINLVIADMIPVFMIFQINRRKQKPHLRDCEFIAVSVDKIDKV